MQGLYNVVALDFDHYEKRLYWLDAGASKIERMRFDGTERETLVDYDIGGAEGLALDWVGRCVKWEVIAFSVIEFIHYLVLHH